MTSRRRTRHHDGPLTTATLALETAVLALSGPQTAVTPAGDTTRLDSRLTQLSHALTDRGTRGARRSTPSAMLPAWIDALKLKINIDTRTATLAAQWAPPPATTTEARLEQLRASRYRPQDSKHVQTMADELTALAAAIDDLFAAKPVILFNPNNQHEWAICPHCGYNHAYRNPDDGQKIRTPALLLTVERGAWCTHCHDVWEPARLGILARMIGHRPPAGVIT